MKRALVITYYWPPAGGSGVQRWLKFIKYFPKYQVEPMVYVPENADYPILDETLQNEVDDYLAVFKQKIWEPYQIAEAIFPKNKAYKSGQFESKEKQSLLSKIFLFIRGNFFIPDARKFWIKPSVKYLSKIIEEQKIEVIITTGPPHSMHLIGLKLKQKYPHLKWIADFRDPWTQIIYHQQLRLLSSARKKHEQLERKVLHKADIVLATSPKDAEKLSEIGGRQVQVLTNGFDDDFIDLKKHKSNNFRITYVGVLRHSQNPENLWKALVEITEENASFQADVEIHLVGNIDPNILKRHREEFNALHVKMFGYLPQKEALRFMKNSELLLLLGYDDEEQSGIIPGKVFSYMASGNPILSIAPKGAAVEKILNDSKSGISLNFDEKASIKDFIIKQYEQWKLGGENVQSVNEEFHYQNLSKKLAQWIKE